MHAAHTGKADGHDTGKGFFYLGSSLVRGTPSSSGGELKDGEGISRDAFSKFEVCI